MDDNQLWQDLTDVFRRVFKSQAITLKRETTTADIPQWDSLNHVQMIVAVERHFGVKFKHAQIAGFRNVGDLADAITAAKAAK